MIAQTGAHEASPGLLDGEDALDGVGRDLLASGGVEDNRLGAVKEPARAGLHGSDARQVRANVAAGFGLWRSKRKDMSRE